MAQVVSGVRWLLGAARVYDCFQALVGADRVRRRFAAEHIRAQAGSRICDIGCGTAAILDYLPDVEYFGFDLSEAYIAAARERFGDRGTFWAERVTSATLKKTAPCDIVLASAILHHLDDDEAVHLFEIAKEALRDGGRLVTYDCCSTAGQSRLARKVVSMDRGQNIRWDNEYRALAERVFPRVHTTIWNRPLRIPYTTICMECRK